MSPTAEQREEKYYYYSLWTVVEISGTVQIHVGIFTKHCLS